MVNENNSLIIKSSITNALLPDFLKHCFWNLSFVVVLGLFYYLISMIYSLSFDIYTIFYLVMITVVLSIIMISKDLIRVLNTKYIFYARHMEYNYSFFTEEIHSVNYSQITDIEIKKDIWDKICGTGDLIIHTSNDGLSENESRDYLIIKDIKRPDHLKNQIMSRVHL